MIGGRPSDTARPPMAGVRRQSRRSAQTAMP
jgi:hypothetical protein